MKGYRFYKEYNSPADKRKDKPNGNVFAAFGEPHMGIDFGFFIDGFASVFDTPNSVCEFVSAHLDWVRYNCKRISETEARQIHPKLFERIEQ